MAMSLTGCGCERGRTRFVGRLILKWRISSGLHADGEAGLHHPMPKGRRDLHGRAGDPANHGRLADHGYFVLLPDVFTRMIWLSMDLATRREIFFMDGLGDAGRPCSG